MWSASRSHHVALAGVLLALGSVLGIVESALLPPVPLPGVRLGLANIAVLVAIALLGLRWGLAVSMGRVFIVGAATGTLMGPAALMSIAGAMAAWVAIAAVSRPAGRFSMVGWSIAGASAHVVAQIAVATALTGAPALLALAPVSLAVASVCGLATGLMALSLVSRTAPLTQGVGRLAGVEAGGTAVGR